MVKLEDVDCALQVATSISGREKCSEQSHLQTVPYFTLRENFTCFQNMVPTYSILPTLCW